MEQTSENIVLYPLDVKHLRDDEKIHVTIES